MPALRVGSDGPFEDAYGYSRAVRVGDVVHVAGTAARGEDLSLDAYGQMAAALRIVGAALELAGADLASVVRTVTYVTDMGDYERVARAHREVFGDIRPAATLVGVAALLDPRMLVEVEAYAVLQAQRAENGDT